MTEDSNPTTDVQNAAETRTPSEERTERVETSEGSTTRRNVLKAGAVGAATAALAGCSALLGGGDDGGGSADVGTETLNAGLLSFTQGAASVLGIQAVRGAEKAVEKINENGGIAGQRELELDVVDEGGDSPVDDYQQFIDDGKDVTFGPISSGTHASMAPEIEANQVVNVGTDGTVTTLYQEGGANPDPTYSFRFQNYDVMEATASAFEVVERLGADNIDTFAGVNPDYAFGEDEMRLFSQAIEGLTGAEQVYSGFPSLGASDFSTHISRINDEEPDVVFSSCWGGDASTFLSQAFQRNMFGSVGTVVGPVFYGSADAIDEEVVTGTEDGKILAGSRNFYWGIPQPGQSNAAQTFFEEARSQDDITVPTAHYMSGYGAVASWATAVEKAIDIIGGYPSQEQISAALEGHGFYAPGGHYQMDRDHQGRSNGYAGVMEWDSDLGAPVLGDLNVFTPDQISPAPLSSEFGQSASDWLSSWE
jgi:branched-chain amino acid transport system substrate-binding protein